MAEQVPTPAAGPAELTETERDVLSAAVETVEADRAFAAHDINFAADLGVLETEAALATLAERGLVERTKPGFFAVTDAGRAAADATADPVADDAVCLARLRRALAAAGEDGLTDEEAQAAAGCRETATLQYLLELEAAGEARWDIPRDRWCEVPPMTAEEQAEKDAAAGYPRCGACGRVRVEPDPTLFCDDDWPADDVCWACWPDGLPNESARVYAHLRAECARREPGVGALIEDVARSLGVDEATASRRLEELEEAGWARYDEDGCGVWHAVVPPDGEPDPLAEARAKAAARYEAARCVGCRRTADQVAEAGDEMVAADLCSHCVVSEAVSVAAARVYVHLTLLERPASTDALAEATGLEGWRATEALEELEAEEMVCGEEGGEHDEWLWTLPTAAPPTPDPAEVRRLVEELIGAARLASGHEPLLDELDVARERAALLGYLGCQEEA